MKELVPEIMELILKKCELMGNLIAVDDRG
jgi:hypothetical protein